MKLTQNRIAGMKCPAGRKDKLVFDDEQRGLGVRVTAPGGKTYLAQYNWHGQKRRIPLGSCSALSLAKARDSVRAIMGDVAKGIDPAAERKKAAAHEALTLRKSGVTEFARRSYASPGSWSKPFSIGSGSSSLRSSLRLDPDGRREDRPMLPRCRA